MENSVCEVQVLRDLRQHTFDNVKMAVMLTDPVEAQLFTVLLKMLNAKKCMEVGTYTGTNCLLYTFFQHKTSVQGATWSNLEQLASPF